MNFQRCGPYFCNHIDPEKLYTGADGRKYQLIGGKWILADSKPRTTMTLDGFISILKESLGERECECLLITFSRLDFFKHYMKYYNAYRNQLPWDIINAKGLGEPLDLFHGYKYPIKCKKSCSDGETIEKIITFIDYTTITEIYGRFGIGSLSELFDIIFKFLPKLKHKTFLENYIHILFEDFFDYDWESFNELSIIDPRDAFLNSVKKYYLITYINEMKNLLKNKGLR